MAWWQWPFFCLGVASAFSLAIALATVAPQLVRGAARVLPTILGRSSAAPKLCDAGLVTAIEAQVQSSLLKPG
jgi:hypothetical protein